MSLSAPPIQILINRKAGAVLRDGEDKVVETLRAIFGSRAENIQLLEGAEITPAVGQLVRTYNDGSRIILAGGGDGTVEAAAEQLLGQPQIPFAGLHLGTFGGFLKRQGFTGDYKLDAVTLRDRSAPAPVDVGMVNDRYFLFGGLLDPASNRLCDAREKFRSNSVLGAMLGISRAVGEIAFGQETLFRVADRPGAAGELIGGKAVAFSKNAIMPRSSEGLNMVRDTQAICLNAVATPDQNDGLIALYALSGKFNALNGNSFVKTVKAGKWTGHKLVRSKIAPALYISHASPDTPAETVINLDGESRTVTFPLRVQNLRGALNVYMPR